jgi:PAS domain S-box-containing protein
MQSCSAQTCRSLLDAAPEALAVLHADGRIMLLNRQAEIQFGYQREELAGQKIARILPRGMTKRRMAAGKAGSFECTGRRKSGREFQAQIRLSRMECEGVALITVAIGDISARKAREGRLLRKIQALERSNQDLGQFASITAHDLEEPLRMVAQYVQLLSRRYQGKLDKDAQEFMAFAGEGAARMQRMIQDLLSLSRVESSRQELREVSSESVFQQALMNLRGAIEDSGAVVTHDPLPLVKAHETQLVQLFQNLLGNAIKYQRPGVPEVHVSACAKSPDQWLFSVRDNGLGIEARDFERIFGMFERLHKRGRFPGTGLGLAICRRIAERHGTRIAVESEVGQGSTFRFALKGSGEPT